MPLFFLDNIDELHEIVDDLERRIRRLDVRAFRECQRKRNHDLTLRVQAKLFTAQSHYNWAIVGGPENKQGFNRELLRRGEEFYAHGGIVLLRAPMPMSEEEARQLVLPVYPLYASTYFVKWQSIQNKWRKMYLERCVPYV